MNIDIVKEKIISEIGIKHKFIYRGLRGQDDIFFGKIYKIYARTFSIITDKGVVKSFSYSDFAIKNLKICG